MKSSEPCWSAVGSLRGFLTPFVPSASPRFLCEVVLCLPLPINHSTCKCLCAAFAGRQPRARVSPTASKAPCHAAGQLSAKSARGKQQESCPCSNPALPACCLHPAAAGTVSAFIRREFLSSCLEAVLLSAWVQGCPAPP